METKVCSQCSHYFIAVMEDEVTCSNCVKDEEIYRLSRKKGDKRNFIPYAQLLLEWKKRVKECNAWRKGELRAAQDRYDRERLEKEKSILLIALNGLDHDPDTLRLYVNTKNQLEVITQERNRLKEANELMIQSVSLLTKENMQLRLNQYRRTPQPEKTSFTKEMWRRFTQLCHPDKHEGSVAATEATRWLLENRP